MNQYHKYPEEYKQDRWEKEFIRIRNEVKKRDSELMSQKQREQEKNGTKLNESGKNTNEERK